MSGCSDPRRPCAAPPALPGSPSPPGVWDLAWRPAGVPSPAGRWCVLRSPQSGRVYTQLLYLNLCSTSHRYDFFKLNIQNKPFLIHVLLTRFRVWSM